MVDDHDGKSKTPTTRRSLLALEYPGLGDFDDPTLEWRRLFSELLGTFFLVLVGAGGAVVNASSHGAISRSTAVTAPGLMVMAIILFMGAVSGAHLNPAVTLGFTLRRRLSLASGAGVHHRPAPRRQRSPASSCGPSSASSASSAPRSPVPGISDWKAMLIELIAHGRAAEHDPRHGLAGPERRCAVRSRRRRLHHPCRFLVEPDQRRFDEPGALVRAGPCADRLLALLGLRRRPDRRRAHRRCDSLGCCAGQAATSAAWRLRAASSTRVCSRQSQRPRHQRRRRNNEHQECRSQAGGRGENR